MSILKAILRYIFKALNISIYPPYVDDLGHSQQSMALPGDMKDALLYGFVYEGDHAKMQSVVDKLLNAPSGGDVTYGVVGKHALLAFMHVEKMGSRAEKIGYSDDHEAAFFIPLLAKGGGLDRVVLWPVYVYVDVYQVAVTGRETEGWRKAYGTVTIPDDPATAQAFSVVTRIFRTFSDTTKSEVTELVELERKGATPGPAATWTTFEEVLAAIKDFWQDVDQFDMSKFETAFDIMLHLFEAELPIVNLKQFRDSCDSRRACYQALVESSIGIDDFKGGGELAHEFELKITQCESDRIADDLGLPAPALSKLAFYLRFDGTAKHGWEVWKAT